MKAAKVVLFFGLIFVFGNCASAQALSVVVNEFLADPASTLAGDANNDGVTSSGNDEFVELLNLSSSIMNLSGWSLSDSTQTRHIFPSGTFINPNEFLAVFGGGSPNLAGVNWQVASTGTLSLNNAGDQISIFDQTNLLIDQITYGSSAGNDQSLSRNPDGSGATFVLHSTIPESAGALFSPGKTISGQLTLSVVPEPVTILSFSLGTLGIVTFKRRINV